MAANGGELSCSSRKKPQAEVPETLKLCAKCQKVLYCSKECQRTDWSSHKLVCLSKADEEAASAENYVLKVQLKPEDIKILQYGVRDPDYDPADEDEEDMATMIMRLTETYNRSQQSQSAPRQNLLRIIAKSQDRMGGFGAVDRMHSGMWPHPRTPEKVSDKLKLYEALEHADYCGNSLEYEYDFGDCWTHAITVTGRTQRSNTFSCTDGGGHPCAEDAGGVHGWTKLVEDDREFLQKQCEVYGDKILSRWRKKSREQRAACLLHAEPDLYPHQWFIPLYTNTSPPWKDTRKHRKSFLLPYLSVKLLKKNPAVLFGLLRNRTLYPLEDWVSFDNKELTLGWAMGYSDLEFCGYCVVMHGPKYGELALWEPKAADRSDIIGLPRARLIIEAQACLLGFLRRVIDQILHSASPEQPVSSSKWVEMTKMGFKKGGDLAFWSQYTYQPFSAPPVFNIDTLLSQAKAGLDAKALWALGVPGPKKRLKRPDARVGVRWKGCRKQLPKAPFSAAFL